MQSDSLILHAVGDICLGDSLISLGFGTRSIIEKAGNDFIFARCRDRLQDADIVFGNLECVLSDRGQGLSPKTRYLRGSPEAIDSVVSGGFDLVNIANNHTLQYGPGAFADTMDLLAGKGIEQVGRAGDERFHTPPVIMSRKGITIGFLGYSYEWEQYFEGPPLYATGQREKIIEDIRKLKTEVDFVVVSLHWGLEYMTHPSEDMVALSHELIDGGCHAVLGHHPHVLQGYESYGGGIIAYSLGNFVFDKMWWPTCRKSVIARITFSKETTKSVGIEMIPIHINRKCQPEIVEGENAASFHHWMDGLNKQIHQTPPARAINYGKMQKFKLQALNFTKFLYILRNFFNYEPRVRNFLVKEKILRLG